MIKKELDMSESLVVLVGCDRDRIGGETTRPI
jgi:hypothetical protein